MDKPRIYVDLNEMVTETVILFSKEDTKTDSDGNVVVLYDKMPVSIYSDDASHTGETDYLLAEGIVIKYDLREYPRWKQVKWCVRIDRNSFMHESDLRLLLLLPIEIKKHPHDLGVLQKCLISFKNQGMDRDAMLKNLEKLRAESDSGTEDVLLELMDFVSGWCVPALSVYES